MIYKRSPYAYALPRNLDYQVVGEALAEVRNHVGQGFTPALVVEAATPLDSPLHDAGFTWDDTEAARKQREQEAAYLIRGIVVVYEDEQEVEHTSRAFVNIIERDSEESRYLPLVTALSDEDYREQYLQHALTDFLALRRKYEELRELARIFDAIDKTTKRIGRRQIAKVA